MTTRWRALGLVLIGLGCVACRDARISSSAAQSKKGEPASPTAATPVTLVTPAYTTRVQTLETTGKVQFNEEQVVRVNAPVTGRVLEVLARPGDVVEPGRRLLLIDSADLGAAKADYAKAVSDVERAEKAIALVRELVDAKAVARKDLRDAENEYRKAVAESERAAARLRTLGVPEQALPDVAARADASTRVVVAAPRSGVIVERNVSPGQVVAFGQSDTPVSLFVIADLSTMWVIADVYEPDLPAVRLGQTVSVSLPCCPGERIEGKVAYISDSVDKESRTVKVRAVVPNRARALKAEMFVKVVVGTESSRVLAIPQTAVHREGGETFVLLEQGKDDYARRAVKLGPDLNGAVEVREGLAPTDRVVAAGSILLKRGAK